MTDASSSRAEASSAIPPEPPPSGKPPSCASTPGSRALRTQRLIDSAPQATRHEREHLRRGAIKPLGVVDQADQCHASPLASDNKLSTASPDQESILAANPSSRAKRCRPARRTVGLGSRSRPLQHRRAQLMQAREGELHLRLHSPGPHHQAPRGPPGQMIKQDGLAHAGLRAPPGPGPHRPVRQQRTGQVRHVRW